MQPHLPQPRGPITSFLCDSLVQPPGRLRRVPALPTDVPATGEDLQLALHICYGLHYDGFVGVADGWEWTSGLIAFRERLEEVFLGELLIESAARGASPGIPVDSAELGDRVRDLLNAAGGRSLSSYMSDSGSVDALREFVIHRSIYQRKEADPHTWAIPRVRGRAKSALVRLQVDEYGGGTPGKSHAELFADTMQVLGLDPTPGAYIDQVPGVTLATDNLVSLFGLHRRWRGALIGHLAAFEMTSVVPMGRYASAVRRILRGEAGAEFYDVHVEADAVHADIAATDLVTGLAESDAGAAADILFGAAALLSVERRFTDHLLDCWDRDASSLRTPSSAERPPVPDHRELLRLEDRRPHPDRDVDSQRPPVSLVPDRSTLSSRAS